MSDYDRLIEALEDIPGGEGEVLLVTVHQLIEEVETLRARNSTLETRVMRLREENERLKAEHADLLLSLGENGPKVWPGFASVNHALRHENVRLKEDLREAKEIVEAVKKATRSLDMSPLLDAIRRYEEER